MPQKLSASFRDPGGVVYRGPQDVILRQINPPSLADYELLMHSGLYDALVEAGLLVSHEEAPLECRLTDEAVKVIRPQQIPFISYPYEWSFTQFKEAALATLQIQQLALARGLSLKDASAYNIQFLKGRPVLIDTLSLEPYEEGEPWIAYGQFCRHFLAPLALMAHVDTRLALMLRDSIDGFPLDLASKVLPGLTKLNPGLAIHIHAHAKSQAKMGDRKIERKGAISKIALLGILDNLMSTVKGLNWSPQGTEWADYYNDTNYSESAMRAKHDLVSSFLKEGPKPKLVWDLGANNGEFSRLAAGIADYVVSWDIDPAAVEKNALTVLKDREENLLPLLLDLTNPSPALGWALQERDSLLDRGPADVALALALVHHLAIGNNVPLPEVASFLARCAETLIIEFVPKEDTQVARLLANREDIFVDYRQDAFEEAFQSCFSIDRKESIPGTVRTLYRMQAKA